MTRIHPSPIDACGLPALEARLQEDLRFLCYPGKDWVPRREGVTDVTIIGAGMCGMLAWFSLRMGGVLNTRVLDRSPEGFEGPWLTYARMETLRSPKHLAGPAAGIPNLTFRAWFEAQWGVPAWEALGKIRRAAQFPVQAIGPVVIGADEAPPGVA